MNKNPYESPRFAPPQRDWTPKLKQCLWWLASFAANVVVGVLGFVLLGYFFIRFFDLGGLVGH